MAVALLALAGVALASSARFKPGRYTGKTSQGKRAVFTISKTAACKYSRNGPTTQCLTAGNIYLAIKCADGSSTNDYAVPTDGIPANGHIHIVIHQSQGFIPGTQVDDVRVHTNGTITGTLSENVTESANGVKCSTGTVKFSAKH
jgi:hypothetical protein